MLCGTEAVTRHVLYSNTHTLTSCYVVLRLLLDMYSNTHTLTSRYMVQRMLLDMYLYPLSYITLYGIEAVTRTVLFLYPHCDITCCMVSRPTQEVFSVVITSVAWYPDWSEMCVVLLHPLSYTKFDGIQTGKRCVLCFYTHCLTSSLMVSRLVKDVCCVVTPTVLHQV